MAETPACARVSQSHVYPAAYRPRNPQLPTCTHSSRPTSTSSRLSGKTASRKRTATGEASSTTWSRVTWTAGLQKEASPGSFARIAGVNSYFASHAKPEVSVRHVMPREPPPSLPFSKTFSTASSSPSSPGPPTKPFTNSWPPPSMTRKLSPAWSPPSRPSPTTKWNPHLHCVVSRGVWLAERTMDSCSLRRHPHGGNSVSGEGLSTSTRT